MIDGYWAGLIFLAPLLMGHNGILQGAQAVTLRLGLLIERVHAVI